MRYFCFTSVLAQLRAHTTNHRLAIWKLGLLPLLLFPAAGPLEHAYAQTSPQPLVDGANFTYDGLTFTIADYCSYTPFGGSVATCATSNGLEMEGVSSSGGAAIEFLGTGSGGTMFSNGGASSETGSVSFDLLVTGTGKTTIANVSNAVTGSSSNATQDAAVFSDLSFLTGGSGAINATLGATPAGDSITPTNSLSFSVTMGVGTAPAGTTLVLSNVGLLFNPAPEPASIALLATGLCALGTVRSRKSQRRS
jgi:hypothetical protein